jgi:hypothetical protein
MAVRANIEKRIEKEKQKIIELHSQIEKAEAFIQGLQEALQMIPKEKTGDSPKSKGYLREGSDMQKIQELLKKVGRPMHIDEILAGIGKSVDKATRASVVSSLHRYSRKGDIFNRVGPNQFTLLCLDLGEKEHPELPPDFGRG